MLQSAGVFVVWPCIMQRSDLREYGHPRVHIMPFASNSPSNDEARAAANLRCLNTYTVITKYPQTAAAEYVRSHCDTYYDYHPEYK